MFTFDYTNESDNDYDFIIHLSDIHIRLQSRREEYEHVFKNLYLKIDSLNESTNNNKTGLIIITGDIFHDKTNLSPEAIKLSLDLFEELSIRHKTIVIQGNHDGLLNVDERMDNITGVLLKKQIPNFHYLKKSGIYRFNNIVFGLSSLYDNKFIPSNELDKYLDYYNLPQSTLKIALYHGMVGNIAISELYEAKGYYKVEDFKGYDYALLGDVHTFQYLNPEKTIGYASSLIGQNFAETDENHGFLYWDLKGNSSFYVPVPNMYCYKMASLDNNLFTMTISTSDANTSSNSSVNSTFDIKDPISLEELKKHIPEHGQIKIIINSDEFNENMKFLKSTFKKVRWTENNMSNLNNTPINPLSKEDENNKSNQNKIIDFNLRDIIRTNVIKNNSLTYDENIINFINNDLETRIKTKERNTRSWELLQLNFSNLCIYGGEQNINFTSLPYNEVILISGNNNVGKSSLIDIITFILYNRMARELNIGRKIASDIINVNHKSGYGELHVKIADNIYIIRKEISRGASNKITIKPFIYEGGQVLYNSADKVAETVEDIFGTFDDFIFMNMMLQFDNVPFRSMKQPDRKELLNRLLGLDQYERIEADIKPIYKDIERQNNELKNKLDKIDPQSLNDKITETNIKITELSTQIIELQDEKTKTTMEIDELNKSYNKSNITLQTSPASINKLITQLNDSINKLQNEINKIDSSIKQIDDSSKSISSEVTEQDKNSAFEKMTDLFLKRQNIYPTKYKSSIEVNKILSKLTEDMNESIKLKEELDKLDSKIASFSLQKSSEHKQSFAQKHPSKPISFYEKQLSNFKTELSDRTDSLSSNENIIRALEKFTNNTKTNNDLEKFDIHKKLTEKLTRLQEDAFIKEGMYKSLSEHEYNPHCAQCMKNPQTANLLKFANDISEININIANITPQIDNTIPEKQKKYEEINAEYQTIREESLKLREDINIINNNIKESIQNISLIKEYEEYTIAKDNLSILQAERNIIKKKLNHINESHTQKMELEFELKTHEKNDEIITTNEKIDIEIATYKNIITIYDLSQTHQKKTTELEQLANKLTRIQEEAEQVKLNHQIETKINELKKIYDTCENTLIKSTLAKNNLEKQNEDITKTLTTYNEDKATFNDINYEYRKYDTYMAILHKNGITLSLINLNLEYIERGVNSIIGRFIKKNVKLSIERNNIELDIIINDENNKDKEVRMLGGRETFIMDIGFKIMLAKIGKMTKSNMLFIDEGISVFDIENMNGIRELFEYLTQNYERVFIMSHIELIKDMVHKVINVRNNGTYSTLDN